MPYVYVIKPQWVKLAKSRINNYILMLQPILILSIFLAFGSIIYTNKIIFWFVYIRCFQFNDHIVCHVAKYNTFNSSKCIWSCKMQPWWAQENNTSQKPRLFPPNFQSIMSSRLVFWEHMDTIRHYSRLKGLYYCITGSNRLLRTPDYWP